jgi:hypothetical protein
MPFRVSRWLGIRPINRDASGKAACPIASRAAGCRASAWRHDRRFLDHRDRSWTFARTHRRRAGRAAAREAGRATPRGTTALVYLGDPCRALETSCTDSTTAMIATPMTEPSQYCTSKRRTRATMVMATTSPPQYQATYGHVPRRGDGSTHGHRFRHPRPMAGPAAHHRRPHPTGPRPDRLDPRRRRQRHRRTRRSLHHGLHHARDHRGANAVKNAAAARKWITGPIPHGDPSLGRVGAALVALRAKFASTVRGGLSKPSSTRSTAGDAGQASGTGQLVVGLTSLSVKLVCMALMPGRRRTVVIAKSA